MATPAEAIAAFSAATGWPEAHMALRARWLREAPGDLWPRSGKGGGKAARHVESHHLASLLMAFAGDQPSDAEEVANTLGKLRIVPGGDRTVRWTHASADGGPYGMIGHAKDAPGDLAKLLLGTLIAVLIETASLDDPHSKAFTTSLRSKGWRISLAPALRAAWVHWEEQEPERTSRSQHYGPAFMQNSLPGLLSSAGDTPVPTPPAPILRTTEIPFTLIEVAGRLLANTKARLSELPLSSLGEAPGSAEPETKNADPSGKGSAPTREPPSGRDTAQGNLHSPEASPPLSRGQAESRPGELSTEGGSSDYDRFASSRGAHPPPQLAA